MRDPHYGRMCFKSVSSTFSAVEKAWPSASAFSTAKNAELLGLYPIRNAMPIMIFLLFTYPSAWLHPCKILSQRRPLSLHQKGVNKVHNVQTEDVSANFCPVGHWICPCL